MTTRKRLMVAAAIASMAAHIPPSMFELRARRDLPLPDLGFTDADKERIAKAEAKRQRKCAKRLKDLAT